jgi:hypothetical protein
MGLSPVRHGGGLGLAAGDARVDGDQSMRSVFGAAIVALAALIQTAAVAARGIEIDSREYQLMLQPEHFSGAAPEHAVSRFVRDQLEPALRRSFGDEAADELAEKGLELDERRRVRFWDTDTCLLTKNGFALRERVDLEEDGRIASEPESR